MISENDSNLNCTLIRHGVNDTFGESGEQMKLLEKFQHDSKGIALIVEKI